MTKFLEFILFLISVSIISTFVIHYLTGIQAWRIFKRTNSVFFASVAIKSWIFAISFILFLANAFVYPRENPELGFRILGLLSWGLFAVASWMIYATILDTENPGIARRTLIRLLTKLGRRK